jgi:hypothetical protein
VLSLAAAPTFAIMVLLTGVLYRCSGHADPRRFRRSAEWAGSSDQMTEATAMK